METVISGIVIGAVVAVVGTWVSYILGGRRDTKQRDREDKQRREQWDREAQQRREQWDRENEFRDYQERRTTYAEFAASTDRLFAGDHSTEAFQKYRNNEAQVRLIAPAEVVSAADMLGYVSRGTKVGNAEYGGALQTFIKTARKDLGKSPEPWT